MRIELLALMGWLAPVAWTAAPKQPVYIYLFSRNSDHVNMDISEERLRRTLGILDRYSRAKPEAHISATLLFSGALAEALAERNAQTGVKDLVIEHLRRGLIEAGYDGADEPTYGRRPFADLSKATNGERRWLSRAEAAERYLTEARHPLTGVAQPGKNGGLKKMQEVFGEAACVTGLVPVGVDPEVVHHLGRHNSKAILSGVPAAEPALGIHGYQISAQSIGKFMSPDFGFSPELYWQDHTLRLSEVSDAALRVVSAEEGPEALRKVLEGLDRSHPRIVHVELVNVKRYLQVPFQEGSMYPPLRFAYDHPDAPALPADARAPAREVDDKNAKEEALVQWIVREFLPANPGSRFVSSSELKEMTPPSTGFRLQMADLKPAVASVLAEWAHSTLPPAYAKAAGHYLSLADLFDVLASALSERSRTGRLPETVRVGKLFGPLDTPRDHGPNVGAVTARAVDRTAAEILPVLQDRAWRPVPKNTVPVWVTVGGERVNGAQFLRLMCEALGAASPETKLQIKMTYFLSPIGEMIPRIRPDWEQGATWTMKPAPLLLRQAAASK